MKETVILTLNEKALKITYEAEEKMPIFYQNGFIDRKYFRPVIGCCKKAAKFDFAAFLQQAQWPSRCS